MEALRGVKLTRTNRSFGLAFECTVRGGSYRSCPIRLRPVAVPRRGTGDEFRFSGGHGEGETPVPIPNTAVKLFIADDTARVTAWESRTPPGYYEKPLSIQRLFAFRLPNEKPASLAGGSGASRTSAAAGSLRRLSLQRHPHLKSARAPRHHLFGKLIFF